MRYFKRFIFITLLLVFLPISSAAAAPPSRQLGESLIELEPAYEYELAENSEDWLLIVERIAAIDEELEGYSLIEAFKLYLTEPCETLLVKLLVPLTTEQEPIVLIINDENIDIQEIGFDEEGRARIDLTEYEVGEYWLCFCVKEE